MNNYFNYVLECLCYIIREYLNLPTIEGLDIKRDNRMWSNSVEIKRVSRYVMRSNRSREANQRALLVNLEFFLRVSML